MEWTTGPEAIMSKRETTHICPLTRHYCWPGCALAKTDTAIAGTWSCTLGASHPPYVEHLKKKGAWMDSEELKEALRLHALWLADREGGKRADMRCADLRCANLRYADLHGADLYDANLYGADLYDANLYGADLGGADLRGADLGGADLRCADLRRADLRCADLRRANIDFACWPLRCGSKGVRADARIAAQLAAHFCSLDCDDAGYLAARGAVLGFALTSHRAHDLGLL